MSIYFDYNATTPVASAVIKKITECLEIYWGNPSSEYRIGKIAKQLIEEARINVAVMINARSNDVIFTSGGTEANNIVIFGIVDYFKIWSDVNSSKIPTLDDKVKPHVITTNVEHDSVLSPLRHLEKKEKIELSVLPVSSYGCISVEDVLRHVKPFTSFITIMQANNETGVIMPVEELGRALKKLNKERELNGLIRILLHTDSAQAVGKIEVNVEDLNVDYLTIVGHKFYGPRIGALYARGAGSASPILPLTYGGGQEKGWRPGTENTAMIAGLGEASRLVTENLQLYQQHMLSIRGYLEERLKNVFGENVHFNCSFSHVNRLPNTCSAALVGDDLCGHVVLSKCQFLMASCGAACHDQNKPSSVLVASGVHPDAAANTIRLSVGRGTSKSDVDLIITDLEEAVQKIKRINK